MTRRRRALLAGLALVPLAACGGPAVPDIVGFEGAELHRATDWSLEGITGAVFVQEGHRLPTAPLQVGIIYTDRWGSAHELNRWIVEQYRRAPNQERIHEAVTEEEACKVGFAHDPPRPFLAVHVCRAKGAWAACVEVDQRIPRGASDSSCVVNDTACWDERCALALDRHRPAVLSILEDVLR